MDFLTIQFICYDCKTILWTQQMNPEEFDIDEITYELIEQNYNCTKCNNNKNIHIHVYHNKDKFIKKLSNYFCSFIFSIPFNICVIVSDSILVNVVLKNIK